MHPQSPLSIVITLPQKISGEALAIALLLEGGADAVHIRKPGWTMSQVEHLLEAIPARCHPQLVVHYHHELVNAFAIGGVHHSNRHPVIGETGVPKSRSCHSLDEVSECGHDYRYVLLSPIFNSISKPGYQSNFHHNELAAFLNTSGSNFSPVVALGGISAKTAPVARQLGFAGMALLGAVWALEGHKVDAGVSVTHFRQIVNAWKQ